MSTVDERMCKKQYEQCVKWCKGSQSDIDYIRLNTESGDLPCFEMMLILRIFYPSIKMTTEGVSNNETHSKETKTNRKATN